MSPSASLRWGVAVTREGTVQNNDDSFRRKPEVLLASGLRRNVQFLGRFLCSDQARL